MEKQEVNKNRFFLAIRFLSGMYHQSARISFFLLMSLALTGVILFFYYPVSYPASYESLAKLADTNYPLSLIRSIHGYFAVLMLLFVLMHAVYVVRERRSSAPALYLLHLSGAGLLLFVMWQGMTGSVMVMDEASQAIISRLVDITHLDEEVMAMFPGDLGVTDQAGITIAAMHLLPPFIAIGLLFLHLLQINEPELRIDAWNALPIVAVVVAGGLLWPLASGKIADFSSITGKVDINWIFAWPVALSLYPPLFYSITIFLLLAGVILIFGTIRKRRFEPLAIIDDKCTGCALCQIDCPVNAIEMIPTDAKARHPWIAVINKKACTGCALCAGSCMFGAIPMPVDNRLTAKSAEPKIIACINADIDEDQLVKEGITGERIYLRCAGALCPATLGSDNKITVITCQHEKCKSRTGAKLADERFGRKRKPWPKKIAAKNFSVIKANGFVGIGKLFKALVFLSFLLFFMMATQYVKDRFPVALENNKLMRLEVTGESFKDRRFVIFVDDLKLDNFSITIDTPPKPARFYRSYSLKKGKAISLTIGAGEDNRKIIFDSVLEKGKVTTIRFDGRSGKVTAHSGSRFVLSSPDRSFGSDLK